MENENQENIFCVDDDEYRVYSDIFDEFCLERFYKNQPKSQTHTNNIRRREQLHK